MTNFINSVLLEVHNTDHTIVYENMVQQRHEGTVHFGQGTVVASVKLTGGANLKCTYDAHRVLSSDFNTIGEAAKTSVDIAAMVFQMNFYTDNTFSEKHR